MERHVTILGVIYIIYSGLFLLVGLGIFITLVGAGAISGDEEAAAISALVGTIIGAFFTLTALPGLVGGIGLLKWQPWARILVLILGFVNLINLPLGTILGAYTIWALLNEDMTRLYNAKARGAA